ncbi:MAG: VPLPA-CTERM sorting domain-containing protein [Pseudomonadota bacterium]
MVDGNASKPVVWRSDDKENLQALISTDGALSISQVIDVAPGGFVLGRASDEGDQRSFVWQPGQKLQFLETDPDHTLLDARAISSSGQVIGQVKTRTGQTYAILFMSSAPPVLLRGIQGNDSQAVGLNTHGDVVGMSEGDLPQAVIWPASGGGPTALSDVIDPALPPGFTLLRADDINDAGMIVANAIDPEGRVHLVRLTPDPTRPGTYISILLGQILSDATDLPDTTLALSETGFVIGTCSMSALDCPRPFDITALDPTITNLAPGAAQPPGFLPLISDRILRGEGIAGAGTDTALLDTPIGTNAPATNPFGPTKFPGVTGGGGGGEDITSAPTTAPIPLPAGFWLLASALIGLFAARRARGI